MATSLMAEQPVLPPQTDEQDPFSASTGSAHHRFSHFDNQLFALGPATSPDQARRALEAHIAETERRIQEASRLGTALVQQRKELGERLIDVQKQQTEGDITPELRQKLVEIEREYNEVGRESARAFLPKSRVSSNELSGSPFGDTKRSISPSKFESQATNSPSKLSVPNNRRSRNQPGNRVHDIEFATEISTSLLSQVRHLQALLAEKEDAVKTLTSEKSRLEVDAEVFNQRLRALDESEQRYKDENWKLEMQIHESISAAKEAAAREQKLTHGLNLLQAEKSTAQKELDEIKLSYAKLTEDHASAVKHYDIELGSVKRSITMAENERGALQRKVEELTGQNQELARAVAHQRGRLEERDQARGLIDEDLEMAQEDHTPEHSPPPSPVKGTPRHSMLESETLKSSLHHAHRMIQSLKANIHREKTEKLELKRMLQDARDDLDSARRGDPGSGTSKRTRKVDSKEFKKPLRLGQLGGARNSRSEVFIDDPNWEEDDGQKSPSHSPSIFAARGAMGPPPSRSSGVQGHKEQSSYSARESESSEAFETANEQATETEEFQTGVEEMSGSDELTETESGAMGAVRTKPPPLALTQAGNRRSFQSTASTSGDEYSYEELRTPTTQQPQRLKLRVGRGANRLSRSRGVSEEPNFQQGSPASIANSSRDGTPQAAGQSLFAELGDMGGSDEDDSVLGTPGRSGFTTPIHSRPGTAKYTPAAFYEAPPPVPKLPMIDSGMMTELWEPEQPRPSTPLTAVPLAAEPALAGSSLVEAAHLIKEKEMKMIDSYTNTEPEPVYVSSDQYTSTDTEPERTMSDKHTSTDAEVKIQMSDAASQWHDEQLEQHLDNFLAVESEHDSRPISTSTYSDRSSQYDPGVMGEKLAKFPSPPQSHAQTPVGNFGILAGGKSFPLAMSTIVSEQVEPIETELAKVVSELGELESTPIAESVPTPKAIPAPLVFSSIHSLEIEPFTPQSPRRDPVIIPRDEVLVEPNVGENEALVEDKEPHTPKATFLGSVLGWHKKRDNGGPIIAEDDTRQSLNNSPMAETPESQRPFREISSNPHERAKRMVIETADESSQTALTANEIDAMLSRMDSVTEGNQKISSPTRGAVGALRDKRSQESIGSISRTRSKMIDPEYVHDTVPLKRPGSAGSGRANSLTAYPPLPVDHKEVIAAAAQRTNSSGGLVAPWGVTSGEASSGLLSPRSGSSGGATGSMGPPPLPASGYRTNPSFRPRTPNSAPPMSPTRGGTTPRPMHSSGTAEIRSQSRLAQTISRTSSVSSFTSEVETRFNLRNGMAIPHGMDSITDPRMINAITQTMIGEFLWKYTRKAGRGTMSENRHRRYFWVHPYTRTLYWSDRDPSSAGRAELKAKSVPIEAVRVVTDDNPMPPGLHRKSLVIMTPGRSVKFTATTGQRHETWFNALSYLLLRTGEEARGDTADLTNGTLTQEDVDEFNPGLRGNRSTRGGPGSLSSYNSRTTRNESPEKSRMPLQPTLSSTAGSRQSLGTFSRLSSYWKPGGKEAMSGSYSSKQSRHSVSGNSGIYEASEVHDSAEDLREIIEKQDRESDKLENVRACCDGKHDVGHLHSSTKGRHATISTATGSKNIGTATSRSKSRNSVMRRTD